MGDHREPAPMDPSLAEALVSASGDGLVAVDRAGRVVAFNPAAGRIFGRDPRQMLGRSFDTLLPEPLREGHRTAVRDYFEGNGHGIMGTTVRGDGLHADGRTIPLEISLSNAVRGGEPLAVAAIRDISPRVEAERRQERLTRELIQAHKAEAVGALAAGIAHDFNANLHTIMGYASALERELPDDSRHLRDLRQILSATEQARELAHKLLSLSSEREVCREVLAVNRLVRDVVGMLRRAIPEHVRVRTHLTRGGHVEGDPTMLRQCLINICINARDAMPDGGELLLRTELLDLTPDEAAERMLAPGRYCALTARDTGTGMSAAVAERVFEPFFTTKPRGQGTGLGLSMVLSTVQGHGGKVELESAPGRGTTLRLLLPATDAHPAPVLRMSTGERTPVGDGEMILLVDDEANLLEMAERLLRGLGYRVLLARSGEQGVALYRKHRHEVAMVVLDVMLGGMSGEETMKQLLAMDPTVKVLVSSGYRAEDRPRALLAQGARGFLQKPYGIEAFSRAIREVLGPGPAK